RDRHPFLPWPSACTHRRHVRSSGAVHALAKTPPGGGARPNPLAPAARPQVDRKTARCGRSLMTACGTFLPNGEVRESTEHRERWILQSEKACRSGEAVDVRKDPRIAHPGDSATGR